MDKHFKPAPSFGSFLNLLYLMISLSTPVNAYAIGNECTNVKSYRPPEMDRSQVTPEGERVLRTAAAMVDHNVMVVGSCWDFVDLVYRNAGFGRKDIVRIFSSKQPGPYANVEDIQPGDWLYYVNIDYRISEHSGIFLGWTNFAKRQGTVISYVGSNSASSGNYTNYNLSKVFVIARPAPGSAQKLASVPLPTPPPFSIVGQQANTSNSCKESTNSIYHDIISGVAEGPDGSVYVGANGTGNVFKFDRDGNFALKFGIKNDGNGFSDGIAVAPDGRVFVTDGYTEVGIFDPNGRLIRAFGKEGTGEGQFQRTGGVAVTHSGEVYVSDSVRNRVLKFDLEGKFLSEFGTDGNTAGNFETPSSIAVDINGNVYVLDLGRELVLKFDSTGKFLLEFDAHGKDEKIPRYRSYALALGFVGIAASSNGEVYVSDLNVIRKFDSQGNQIGTFTDKIQSGKTPLISRPKGLAVSRTGNLLVGDSDSNRIQVLPNF